MVWCFIGQLTSMVPAGNKISLAGDSGCGRRSQREPLAQCRALPWGSQCRGACSAKKQKHKKELRWLGEEMLTTGK